MSDHKVKKRSIGYLPHVIRPYIYYIHKMKNEWRAKQQQHRVSFVDKRRRRIHIIYVRISGSPPLLMCLLRWQNCTSTRELPLYTAWPAFRDERQAEISPAAHIYIYTYTHTRRFALFFTAAVDTQRNTVYRKERKLENDNAAHDLPNSYVNATAAVLLYRALSSVTHCARGLNLDSNAIGAVWCFFFLYYIIHCSDLFISNFPGSRYLHKNNNSAVHAYIPTSSAGDIKLNGRGR